MGFRTRSASNSYKIRALQAIPSLGGGERARRASHYNSLVSLFPPSRRFLAVVAPEPTALQHGQPDQRAQQNQLQVATGGRLRVGIFHRMRIL